ncbi:MAG: glycosyltransferase family 2 protein [Alphaproteobacteria bacterium]
MRSVSFVSTFYNKDKYVDIVLEYIRGQNGITDAEYIFVDDGSTDRTLEKLEQGARSFGNVKIISIENSGPAIATNVGLAEVSKEYVKLVDGDDLLHPDATVKLIEACERCGTGLAFGDLLPYDAEEVLSGGRSPNLPPLDRAPIRVIADPLDVLAKTVLFNLSMTVIRSDLVKKTGGCDPRVFVQDVSLALRMAYHTKFAKLDGAVGAWPRIEATRVSGNQAQVLHDVSYVFAFFIADHGDLPARLKRTLLRQAWGRAWKWASRRGGASVLSTQCLFNVLAQLRLLPPSFEMVERSCHPFRATDAIRVPDRDPSQARR